MAVTEITNKAKILVLCATPWDMTKDGGEKGVTVEFLYWGDGGETLAPHSEWNPLKQVGVRRGKCSMDLSFREKMPIAPAIYLADFYMNVNGQGQSIQKLRDVAFVSNVKFEAYSIPGLVVPGMVQPEPEQPKNEAGKK